MGGLNTHTPSEDGAAALPEALPPYREVPPVASTRHAVRGLLGSHRAPLPPPLPLPSPSHAQEQRESPPPPLSRENTFGPLQHVAVHPPSSWEELPLFYRTMTRIFEGEKVEYMKRACAQHRQFVEVLQREVPQVSFTEPIGKQPIAELFTCDLGAVIDDAFFQANFHCADRRVEEGRALRTLRTVMPQEQVHATPTFLEGGDILPFGDILFVGVSHRGTEEETAQALQEYFGTRKTCIELRHTMAHLDCAMCVTPTGHILVMEKGLTPDAIDTLEERFPGRVIRLAGEQGSLPLNVLYLSPTKAITAVAAKECNQKLHALGVETIELENDALAAFGGSFRCLALDLRRA